LDNKQRTNLVRVDHMAAGRRALGAVELRAQLPGSADSAGFRGLAQAVSELIVEARLPLGARMPAERELAAALGLSRTTVSAAYDLLREHGYLRSRQGAGSWITIPQSDGARRLRQPQLSNALEPPDVIDLAIAAPSAPSADILAAIGRAAEAVPRYLGGSGYATLGLDPLRSAIAGQYGMRGLPTSADQILITSGAQQGIDLVVKTLSSPGDRVVVDNPTYPGALDSLAAARARVVPVDLRVGDSVRSWDLDAYTTAVRQTAPALAYLIADFHNPTGALLDDEGRRRIVAVCRQAGTPLLVDETLADLALDDATFDDAVGLGPVAARDLTGGVITVGSLSKSMWGGLRIGWIRADPQLIFRFAVARARTDMAGPVLEQLIAVELLRNHAELAAARRAALREQRDGLVAALSEAVPQWRFRTPPGGLSLWVELDGPISSTLSARAAGVGLRLAPGRRFGSDIRLDRWLRVPFTHRPEALEEAARRLAQLRQQLLSAEGTPSSAPVLRDRVELIA
jgi:DNA-binding transcriptional MocR family regulator